MPLFLLRVKATVFDTACKAPISLFSSTCYYSVYNSHAGLLAVSRMCRAGSLLPQGLCAGCPICQTISYQIPAWLTPDFKYFLQCHLTENCPNLLAYCCQALNIILRQTLSGQKVMGTKRSHHEGQKQDKTWNLRGQGEWGIQVLEAPRGGRCREGSPSVSPALLPVSEAVAP